MSDAISFAERMQAARQLQTLVAKGQVRPQDLTQMFTTKLENPEEGGRIPFHQMGLHRLGDMVELARDARPWGVYTKSDVLDSTITGGNNATGGVAGATGGGVLARIDLEPIVYNWFLTRFPGLERIAKERANGLAHTWNISTTFDAADAVFTNEFGGGLVRGQGGYRTVNTNIAVLVVERGSSIKERLGVLQSGMGNYQSGGDGGMSTVDLELQRGVWASALTFQTCLYQGTQQLNGTNPYAGTESEYGKTYTNGFTGLRQLISSVAPSGFYPSGFAANIVEQGQDKDTSTIKGAINRSVQQIVDAGGMPNAIHLSATAATKLAAESDSLLRLSPSDVGTAGATVGIHVRYVDTIAGPLEVVMVPGNSIGYYAAPNGSVFQGGNCEDIYVLEEGTLSFPFLGSANPTTLEIPAGIDATSPLANRYLVFWMAGFAMKIPVFNGKVRIAHS